AQHHQAAPNDQEPALKPPPPVREGCRVWSLSCGVASRCAPGLALLPPPAHRRRCPPPDLLGRQVLLVGRDRPHVPERIHDLPVAVAQNMSCSGMRTCAPAATARAKTWSASGT